MNQLIILLKYGLKGSSSVFTGKQRSSRSFFSLFISIIAYLPISFVFYDFFKSASQIQIGRYNLATVFLSYWSILMGGIFIVSFVPSLVSSFVRNEEIQFLLTLPVKRSTIVFYQMILTLVLQSFTVIVYLFVVPIYSLIMKKSILFGILNAFLMCFFLLSISVLLASLLGLWMSRSTAKKITVIGIILTLIALFTAIQFPDMVSNQQSLEKFVKIGQIFLSKVNIFSWPILAISGEYIYTFYLAILCTGSWFLCLRVSEMLTFEEISAKKKKVSKKYSGLNGFYWKDLKLVFRHHQSIFMIIYPVVFGLIFAFSNRWFVSPMLITIVISTMYTSMNSALLMKQEFETWPFCRLLPLTSAQLIMPKIIIPSLIYTIIFAGMTAFFQAFFHTPLSIYAIIFVVFILYVFASTFGAYLFMKEARKVEISNPSRILNIKDVILLEAISFALSIASILPLSLYMFSQKTLSDLFGSQLMTILVGVFLPAGTLILTAGLIKEFIKKIFDRWRSFE